jgi:hypothetical protein
MQQDSNLQAKAFCLNLDLKEEISDLLQSQIPNLMLNRDKTRNLVLGLVVVNHLKYSMIMLKRSTCFQRL